MGVRVPASLRTAYRLWVELFVLVNVAFLALDIYFAHSENDFARRPEYIPLYFSLIAPVFLAIALALWRSHPVLWEYIGYAVGWLAIIIGFAGVSWHLESQFFHERTLRSLTYAAPFVAPLAYSGLGLLLLINRAVDVSSLEWAQWVLFLALGGFAGNFVLSLTDHAADGFYRWEEWIPVIASAFAVGFLLVPFLFRVGWLYLLGCAAVLVVEAGVGGLGFVLHGLANLHGPSHRMFENLVAGAPPFAPLLFPNLTVLGLIALHVYERRLAESRPVLVSEDERRSA